MFVSLFYVPHCLPHLRAHVDDLEARLLQELRRLVPKPSLCHSFRSPSRLIDVDAVQRSRWTSIPLAIFGTGSDDVSQYVNTGGLRAVMVSVSLY